MKTLDKVVGWFVEAEEERTPTETAPIALVPPVVSVAAPPRVLATFADVYEAAGIGRDDQDRVDRTLELLATLPAATPVEVQRTIVEASMRAFAIPLDAMLSTVDAEIAALDRHEAGRAADAETEGHRARARIEALEAEIAELRAVVEAESHSHAALAAEVEDEKRRVSALNAFFGR